MASTICFYIDSPDVHRIIPPYYVFSSMYQRTDHCSFSILCPVESLDFAFSFTECQSDYITLFRRSWEPNWEPRNDIGIMQCFYTMAKIC